MFLLIRDSKKNVKIEESYFRIGFNRVKYTITHLRNYKNLAVFLLAFFFYIEGVNTVIFFSGNYARTTLNFSFIELAVFFIIVQTTAILGAVVFGKAALAGPTWQVRPRHVRTHIGDKVVRRSEGGFTSRRQIDVALKWRGMIARHRMTFAAKTE